MGIRSIGYSITNIKHINHNNHTTAHHRLPLLSYQTDDEIDISSWKLPTNIPLADDGFHESWRIDIILGAEVF